MTDILTLRFDPAAQEYFEEMRQRYFPPALNRVPAHLTLFHSLPAIEEISSTLDSVAAATTVFPVAVNGVRSLGRGVAFTLAAPGLLSLHAVLSRSFAEHLTPQDRQKFQPHVVIQNKSTGEQARHLLALLQASFRTFEVKAEGLTLWHYRDGPWDLAREFEFGCRL